MASVQYLSIDDDVALIIKCLCRAVIFQKRKTICLGLVSIFILVITRGPPAVLLHLGIKLDSLEFEAQLQKATDLVLISFQSLLVKW